MTDNYYQADDGTVRKRTGESIQPVTDLLAKLNRLEKVAEESALLALIDLGGKRISTAAYNQIVKNLHKALREAGYLKEVEGE
jgi:hypothetical protein